MTRIFTTLAVIAGLAVAPAAIAGESGRHSARSVDLSGQAASAGGSAVVTGAATVASVPLVVGGSALAVTGSALQSAGESVIDAGSDLYTTTTRPVRIPAHGPMADAAPRLD